MANEKPKASSNLRVTRLELRNWKNFPRVDIELKRRAFVVGPNAAGKSNLIDALRFLKDVVGMGGGFLEAVSKRNGVSVIRSLAARRYPSIVVDVTIGNDLDNAMWRYRLAFKQDNQRRPQIEEESVWKLGGKILSRPNSKDVDDPIRLTQTDLEQVTANADFRAVADFFATIQYLHIVPQLVREPDRSVGITNDPFGGDFLEQIAQVPDRTQKSRLRRIQAALKVAVPQLTALELDRDSRGVPHLRGRYEHWRNQGAWQDEKQFSDGTLRLMGLLWAVLDGRGPLLVEEPELSLHPGVVRFLPQLFSRMQRASGRQVVVSTHSSDLLQDAGIGLDEVVLLSPSGEGTDVSLAKEFDTVVAILEGGGSLADAIMPVTSPRTAEQLVLFEAS